MRHGMILGWLVCMLWPMSSHAWRVNNQCWGDPSIWDGRPAFMRLTRDPTTDDWGRAFERSLLAWNNVAGADRMFDWEVRSDLRVAVTGNDRNEVGVVLSREIDGTFGVTYRRRRICVNHPFSYTATGDLLEADVLIASDKRLFLSDIPDCDQHVFGDGGDTAGEEADAWRMTREATILHEFGHALGFDHEDDAMSLMMTSHGEGRYCGYPQFAPHPDEIAGMQSLYGDGRIQHDIAASSFEWQAADEIRMTMFRETLHGCPGQIVDMRWSVANRGTHAIRYDVFWYASRSPHFALPDDDLLKVERGLNIAPGVFETRQSGIRVSANQTPGVPHYVRFVLVPDVDHELHVDNNQSYTAARLVRLSYGVCP